MTVRCGSYPLMNLAADYGVDYGDVLLVAGHDRTRLLGEVMTDGRRNLAQAAMTRMARTLDRGGPRWDQLRGAIFHHAFGPALGTMTVVSLDDFRPGNGPCRRERIFAKVLERVVIHEPRFVEGRMQACGCWEWTGPDSGKPKEKNQARGHSYPRMNLDGGTMAVHIVMWTVVNGPIPPRKQLDHMGPCWTRKCVNPAHLELVTHKRNQKRRDLKRRLLGRVAA